MLNVSKSLQPATWYRATANPSALYPTLTGAVDCDVCVVGAGIAGCSTALHLAERGYRVVVLEQQNIGWGASGRSGAQAIFGFAIAQDQLTRLIGERDARAAFDVSVEGLALMKSLIAKHGIDCAWVDGQLHVAMRPRQDRDLRDWVDQLHARHDYHSVSLLEREQLRGYIASDRYSSAMLDTNSGHLHPLNYTLGLARAAAAAGVRIFEHSRALRYEQQSETPAAVAPLRVLTESGRVNCRQLVFCGNAGLGDTVPQLARKVMAVATYVVATEPLGESTAQMLLPHNSAVTDVNWVLDYFRRSADHRLLFGGRISYSGVDAVNSTRATVKRMRRVFPQLASARIEYSWGGDVDLTLNRAPHFGRLAPNIYFMQGFSGHGMVLAAIAGKLVAEAIAGTNERFDVFARIPHHDFPGGLGLRRPALVLGMLWYRLRDLL